ncbi:MAG: DUF1501 domain-containing protein [Planctomycetaceae bacterium]
MARTGCYVAIPGKNAFSGGAGFLGSTHGHSRSVLTTGANGYQVRDFSIPNGVSFEEIRPPVNRLDRSSSNDCGISESDPNVLDTMDDFYKQAYSLLTSRTAQAAFSLDSETDETKRLYGSHVVGLKGPDNKYHPKGLAERLIVARRLVESGVRFVTVTYGAWDCHVDVKSNTLDQMPALDAAIAGLVTDLDQRGLLDTTIFWLTSEFGRTPKVNRDGGRDHHAKCYSNLIAGGGFTQGQFYGVSDATGAEPARDAVILEDLLCTIYHQLGIDANRELLAFGTRPIEIIKGGNVVRGLLS